MNNSQRAKGEGSLPCSGGSGVRRQKNSKVQRQRKSGSHGLVLSAWQEGATRDSLFGRNFLFFVYPVSSFGSDFSHYQQPFISTEALGQWTFALWSISMLF